MASPDQYSFEPGQSLSQKTLLSSLGGFSQPATKQIRSLQELLRAIQPLVLQLYDGSDLQEDGVLGEGMSYDVFRYRDIRKQTVVAVKQVKLPSSKQGKLEVESFQIRVSCVLKDIEVMHHAPLAAHPNIINLLGYGWQLQKGSIPFLVTECATLGTLRKYLKATPMSARQQQKFCRHVALGLHELHMSGIAHGDVKLDNVLVVLQSPLMEDDAARLKEEGSNLEPVAKISDFGHALLLSDDQGGDRDQRYYGTTAYNAPELFIENQSQQRKWTSTGFRRCDAWAYGLLCLEALSSGRPYYSNERVRNRLSRSSAGSGSRTLVASADSQQDILAAFRPWISDIAKGLASRVPSKLTSMSFIQTFRLCLVSDPSERIYDVSSLPILAYGAYQELPPVRPRLDEGTEKLGQWLFENFRPRKIAQIPHIVKSQIFSDSQRLAAIESSSASRAAFQAGLAHATGFGTPKNSDRFLASMTSCAEKGHPISRAFNSFFTNDFYKAGGDHPKAYSQVLVFAFKQSRELAKRRESRIEQHRISKQSPLTVVKSVPGLTEAGGDTPADPAILVAAQLGDVAAVLSLLGEGVDPVACSKDGSNILHWLFMFPMEMMREVGQMVIQKTPVPSRHALIHQIATGTRLLDSQFPLELRGTPLSYAVATASEVAVTVLLELGADPAFTTGEASRHHSPIWLAASLHYSQMLKVMLPVTTFLNLNLKVSDITILQTLSESSPLERELIHGQRSVAKCYETLRTLAIFSSESEKGRLLKFEGNIVPALELAISARDLVVAEALLDVCRDFKDAQLETTLQLCRIAILRTALHTACRDIYDKDSSFELISFALLHSSDVNATAVSYQNCPPIFVTIEHQKEDLFNFVLARGADLTARDDKGRCAVHLFAIHGFFKSLPPDKILSMGISLDVVDSRRLTPLHYAANSGILNQTQLLLQHGANTTREDSVGYRALHHAVTSKTIRVVEAVLPFNTKMNINSPSHENLMTPLAIAAKDGNHDIVRHLLENGADSFQAVIHGKLPIHLAAEYHRALVVEELLDRQPQEQVVALLAAKTDSQRSPLDLSVDGLSNESDNRITCSKLLAAGSDPTQSLLATVKNNYTWLVKYLLDYSPNLGYHDILDGNDPTSALTAATLIGNTDIVELLLKAGADCNQLDGNGANAIHCAVIEQNWELLDIFLATRHPSVNCQDAKGATPLDLALASGPLMSKPVAVGLCYQLLSAGASSPRQPWPQWFSRCDLEFFKTLDKMSEYLGSGANSGSLSLAKEFIRRGIHSRGAIPGGRDLNSLHIWATLPDICKLIWWDGSGETFAITKATACLLESGADGLSLDNAGRTVLSRAIDANNTAMCGALLTQYTLIIDGLAKTVTEFQGSTTEDQNAQDLYMRDVQECWANIVGNRKWHIIDVFITSKIPLDMTLMTPIIVDFFIYALTKGIGPVLGEFTRPPKWTAKIPVQENDAKGQPQKSARVPSPKHTSVLPRWMKWMKSRAIVRESDIQPAQEIEGQEKIFDFQNPRVVLQDFWQYEIVGSNFSELNDLVPESMQPRLALLIVENGLVERVERTAKSLRDSSSSQSNGSLTSQMVPRRLAIQESTALVKNLHDLTTATYMWPRDHEKLTESLGKLLTIQSEIQLEQLSSVSLPKEISSLSSGLDLLDIRTNALINFIRDIAKDSPVLAMSYGFSGISLLQGLRHSRTHLELVPIVSWVESPTELDIYYYIEREVEKVYKEIVSISLVTVKRSSNIVERGWLYVLSNVHIAAAQKLDFPYYATVTTFTSPQPPRSFELDASTALRAPLRDGVWVLIPADSWWLVKTVSGIIGLLPANKMLLSGGPPRFLKG